MFFCHVLSFLWLVRGESFRLLTDWLHATCICVVWCGLWCLLPNIEPSFSNLDSKNTMIHLFPLGSTKKHPHKLNHHVSDFHRCTFISSSDLLQINLNKIKNHSQVRQAFYLFILELFTDVDGICNVCLLGGDTETPVFLQICESWFFPQCSLVFQRNAQFAVFANFTTLAQKKRRMHIRLQLCDYCDKKKKYDSERNLRK